MRQFFPIMHDPILKAVPWSLVQPHEAQALKNHGQTLNELASRQGLDIIELACVLADRPWNLGLKISDANGAQCRAEVLARLAPTQGKDEG